jgi:hypothetical protein
MSAKGGRPYQREDARLRKLYKATPGLEHAEEIRHVTGASFADAWRISQIRTMGNGRLQRWWSRGECTFRVLWRIVTDHPGDFDRQFLEYKTRSRRGVSQKKPDSSNSAT